MAVKELCPICLEYRSEFEGHHVIWRAADGTDDPVNLLRICKNCHAILTFGEFETAIWYNRACESHQRMVHGFEFDKRAYGNAEDSELFEYREEAERNNCVISDDEINRMVIKFAGLSYNVSMAVIHKIISPDEAYDLPTLANKIFPPIRINL